MVLSIWTDSITICNSVIISIINIIFVVVTFTIILNGFIRLNRFFYL